MRFLVVSLFALVGTLAASAQSVPRPPGWIPTPPGGSAVVNSPVSYPVIAPKFAAAESRFIVEVPADAVVKVDGKETKQAGNVRAFTSEHQQGEYEFTAEVQRGGVIYQSTRRARLLPGRTTRLSFSELGNCSGGY